MSAPSESGAVEAWTVQRVLSWATEDFRARSFESPRLDAELLLSESIGLDRVRLIIEAKRPLSPAELAKFRELIKRRRSGEPVAYILGRREFFGLVFRVDSRVLIPRPDTEALVEVALERTRSHSMYGRMLDLCTGSGAVAVAFAKQRPTWRVTASDVSADALQLAQENALRLGTIFGMSFCAGDLFAALAAEQRFELVTANPPYIPDAELQAISREIREFEPALALVGGPDGLDVVRRVVAGSRAVLEPGGVLAVEVHYDQAGRVRQLLEAEGFSSIETRRDYGGHERVVSGTAPAGGAAPDRTRPAQGPV
ncbi:MAG: peptide chain release factor N(5)-glutamine methyltransferase [Polyangiaceae bacterium]